MANLTETIKLVREMEDDELATSSIDGAGDTGFTDEPLEPSEPPVSDSAIGADTEGETALGLLRQMRDLLTQLVSALAPAPEGEGEAAVPEGDMPPIPPEDEEGAEGEPFEGKESPEEEGAEKKAKEAEEEEDEELRNRRPE